MTGGGQSFSCNGKYYYVEYSNLKNISTVSLFSSSSNELILKDGGKTLSIWKTATSSGGDVYLSDLPSTIGTSVNYYATSGYSSNGNKPSFKITRISWLSPTLNSDGVYEISSADELYWFAALVNGNSACGVAQNQSAKGKLTADITIDSSFTPIGTSSKPFKGTFDGDEHTISGLDMTLASSDTSTGTGLFGCVEKGTVKNLAVSGTITNNSSSNKYIGGVIGSLKGGTVSNVASSVNITHNDKATHTGGIVGSTETMNQSNTVTIENCLYNGTLTTNSTINCVGGIIGYVINKTSIAIKNCGFAGTISSTATNGAGGIFGYINTGSDSKVLSVEGCWSAGTLKNCNAIGYIKETLINSSQA